MKVYTSKDCQRCSELKEFLLSEGISFEEISIADKRALVELRRRGIMPYTPILQVSFFFFTPRELFVHDKLDKTRVRNFLTLRK